MKLNSMELIYKTLNLIATRKHDAETEQRLANAIERELLAINPQAVPEQWKDITPLSTPEQAGIAA